MERKKNKQTYHVHTQSKIILKDIKEVRIHSNTCIIYTIPPTLLKPLGVAAPKPFESRFPQLSLCHMAPTAQCIHS